MILGRIKRGSNEWNDHYLTKVLIAELADKYIGTLATEADLHLITTSELQFKPIWIEQDTNKPRFYSGDIVLLLLKDEDKFRLIKEHHYLHTDADLQDMTDFIMNVEVDGIVGHTGQHKVNNSIRDEELMKQCRIPVHRIDSLDRKQRKKYQEILKAEIESFFFRHHPLVIN